MNWYKTAKNKSSIEKFDYSSSLRNLWENILRLEQKRVNISFSLENNDGYDIKTKNLKYVSKNGDHFRIKAQVSWAAGDWEAPICYFRCQYEKRSYGENNKKWYPWSSYLKTIIIPEKNNINLTEGKKGKVALEADDAKKTDIQNKKLWDELIELANKRIKYYWEEYINQFDEKGDASFENTGCVKDLTKIYK